MKSPQFGVTYVSPLSGNRRTIHLWTKREALSEAQNLYREGCKYIDAFKFSESVGAVSFDWRKF
jgi:hypothetical protein